MKLKNIVFLFASVLIFSCESNQIEIESDNLLLGNWVEPIYDGETTTFKRSNSLQDQSYGVSFKEEGVFIERSSGFCGTPPLFFSDFEGSFEKENTLIEITTDFFPGNFNWRILSLTEENLVVKRELSDQEKDHRALMDLFNVIQNLSYSVTCSDSSNWTFTAYGSKACGGPQGFIPYSKDINVLEFLKKVEEYTKNEKEFNIKWSIISTCDVPSQPKSVNCVNGIPSLVY